MLVVPLLVVMTNQRGAPTMGVNCHFGMRTLLAVQILSCEIMYLRFISTVGHSFYEVRRRCDCQ